MSTTATAPANVRSQRKTVSNEDFIKVNIQATKENKGIKYIAETLGLNESYVTQRRSSLRKAGVALPELVRGNQTQFDRQSLNKIIAEMTGTPMKDIEAASQVLLQGAEGEGDNQQTQQMQTTGKGRK